MTEGGKREGAKKKSQPFKDRKKTRDRCSTFCHNEDTVGGEGGKKEGRQGNGKAQKKKSLHLRTVPKDPLPRIPFPCRRKRNTILMGASGKERERGNEERKRAKTKLQNFYPTQTRDSKRVFKGVK
jgi:hypothetical protein